MPRRRNSWEIGAKIEACTPCCALIALPRSRYEDKVPLQTIGLTPITDSRSAPSVYFLVLKNITQNYIDRRKGWGQEADAYAKWSRFVFQARH